MPAALHVTEPWSDSRGTNLAQAETVKENKVMPYFALELISTYETCLISTCDNDTAQGFNASASALPSFPRGICCLLERLCSTSPCFKWTSHSETATNFLTLPSTQNKLTKETPLLKFLITRLTLYFQERIKTR